MREARLPRIRKWLGSTSERIFVVVREWRCRLLWSETFLDEVSEFADRWILIVFTAMDAMHRIKSWWCTPIAMGKNGVDWDSLFHGRWEGQLLATAGNV